MTLTARQQEILDLMRAFAREHGYPPTVRDVCKLAAMTPNAVMGHLKRLEKAGGIRRGKGARCITFCEDVAPRAARVDGRIILDLGTMGQVELGEKEARVFSNELREAIKGAAS